MRNLSTYEIVNLTRNFLKANEIGFATLELFDGTKIDFQRSIVYGDVYVYLYINSIEIDYLETTEGISSLGIEYLINQIILQKEAKKQLKTETI